MLIILHYSDFYFNKYIMKKIYSYIGVFMLILTLTIFFLYIKNTNNKSKATNQSLYSLKVIENKDSWIYEIYKNDTMFIRQEYIPSAKGKQSFKTKEDAKKIGNLVVSKLSKNVFPVISKNDLINNNINFENK
ncbi:DUF4907 domain-containing protein [Winogradskyella sp. HL2-2]|uniref:DUF4907 domain-containing protein n=2 Tax=Winogradskyella endarachnes TaxID=2681965 RepID=A0A6L6U8D9_9FLAO|nr:DUF4907 domain-containing protein [Winogradskyella endarachnes]